MRFLLSALGLLLAGCGILGGVDTKEPPKFYTPHGLEVHFFGSRSFQEKRFTVAQVLKWLDENVEEWARFRASATQPEALLMTYARQTRFYIYDDYQIEVKDGVYAAGFTFGSLVGVAIYGYTKGPEKPENPPVPWLVRPNPNGGWIWGILTPGHELPATAHEMDHRAQVPGSDHD